MSRPRPPPSKRVTPSLVAKCYNRFFPVCRRMCPKELDQLIQDCGYDNRVHPVCQQTWRALQRCMRFQGFWPDLSNTPPPRKAEEKK